MNKLQYSHTVEYHIVYNRLKIIHAPHPHPKNIYTIFPGTCAGYLIKHKHTHTKCVWGGIFADVIELRIL